MKFGKISKENCLFQKLGDDEFCFDDDFETETRKCNLRCQKEAELVEELGNDALSGEVNEWYCLVIVIDDEVFQSILNAPEPAKG